MIIPCEVAARSVVPAVKAMMARHLLEKDGLTQERVATILGISQSAVSKYITKIRGHAIEAEDVEEVEPLVREMVKMLAEGNFRKRDFLTTFCQACTAIRKARLMCHFCRETELAGEGYECDFCFSSNTEMKNK